MTIIKRRYVTDVRMQIRRCVFETNSSSTHSISIYTAKEPLRADIPKNTVLEVDGSKAYDRKIFDEVGKLNYIISMLATMEEYCDDNDEITYNKDDFNEFISQPKFKWLSESVKEERNTDIIYTNQSECGFPYYETGYDDDHNIEYIFSARNNYNVNNELDFKKRCKEIIFDRTICIEDKENEY